MYKRQVQDLGGRICLWVGYPGYGHCLRNNDTDNGKSLQVTSAVQLDPDTLEACNANSTLPQLRFDLPRAMHEARTDLFAMQLWAQRLLALLPCFCEHDTSTIPVSIIGIFIISLPLLHLLPTPPP